MIEAAFQGVCGQCGERYPIGTKIARDPQVGWMHAPYCPPDVLARPAQPGEVVCSDCFLIHPAGACDR